MFDPGTLVTAALVGSLAAAVYFKNRRAPKTAPAPQRLTGPRPLLADPTTRTWGVANKLLDHHHGCRCSTCELSARLGATIRQKEGLPA